MCTNVTAPQVIFTSNSTNQNSAATHIIVRENFRRRNRMNQMNNLNNTDHPNHPVDRISPVHLSTSLRKSKISTGTEMPHQVNFSSNSANPNCTATHNRKRKCPPYRDCEWNGSVGEGSSNTVSGTSAWCSTSEVYARVATVIESCVPGAKQASEEMTCAWPAFGEGRCSDGDRRERAHSRSSAQERPLLALLLLMGLLCSSRRLTGRHALSTLPNS